MEIKEYWAKPGITIGEHAEMLMQIAETLKEFGYINKKDYELLRKACLHHDDGKANEQFQKRVKSTKWIRFNPEKEVPHNVLSGFLLNPEEFENPEDYLRVLFAIMYHHDYGNPYDLVIEKKTLIKNLLKDFGMHQIKRSVLNLMQRMKDDDQAIKLKGLLHKCDYSASGNYVVEYPNDFLEESLENVKKKWRIQNPSSDWNELQKYCIAHRDENLIVIAQTGMGKTEAGLQWIGNHKGYFVLPLRTAINAIYDRVKKEILLEENLDTRLSILHSESLEYYTRYTQQDMDLIEYENRGKRFSMPLNISTMDQLFDFVLKYQGYELKLTTLSYSKIVIDEIQMYDPELLAYLIYGMKRILELGGKIAVMTATLAPFVRDLIMEEIPGFKKENLVTFTNDMIRHNVNIEDKMLQAKDIVKCFHENIKKGKSSKILVVCNSIKKVKEIYRELEECLEDKDKLHVLHSQFTKRDRAKLEVEIIDFGKTYTKNKQLDEKSGIWISTSLVEASLDIDFDFLFTELQDLNSLFQRMGRCNRKGIKNVKEPNCFIYLQINESLLKGKNPMIDETIFLISQAAIKNLSGQISENQKLEILNDFLRMEKIKESTYMKKYNETMRFIKNLETYELEKDEMKLRNILSIDVIPNRIYEENKEDIFCKMEILKEEAAVIEQMKAKEDIMDYSLNIPYYKWINYQKAVKSDKAISYPVLDLGQFGKIPVIECIYDNLGFEEINYKEIVREVEFL